MSFYLAHLAFLSTQIEDENKQVVLLYSIIPFPSLKHQSLLLVKFL